MHEEPTRDATTAQVRHYPWAKGKTGRPTMGLDSYADGPLIWTDRMLRISEAMGYDVFDYILEARLVDHLTSGQIARMLSEDSGIAVSGTTVERWASHALANDYRVGHFFLLYISAEIAAYEQGGLGGLVYPVVRLSEQVTQEMP